MKNKLAKIVAVFTVVGLMSAGPVAYAVSGEDDSKSHKSSHRGEGKEFMKELNLTPEQREKLLEQRNDPAKQGSYKAIHEQLKTKTQALYAAIAKPGATRADVSELIDEVNVLTGQMFSQKIDGIFAMKEILTPEQFAKMQEKHQVRMNKDHEGWGKKKQGSDQG
ncbi:MAG: hypothetical protein ABH891_04560 [Candidatus Omnitrophota bacterium]